MSTKVLKFFAVDTTGNRESVKTETYDLVVPPVSISRARQYLMLEANGSMLRLQDRHVNGTVRVFVFLSGVGWVGPSTSNSVITVAPGATLFFQLMDSMGVIAFSGSVSVNDLNTYFDPWPVSAVAAYPTTVALFNDHRMSLDSQNGWVDVWHLVVNGSVSLSQYHVVVWNSLQPNSTAPLNKPRSIDGQTDFQTYYSNTPGGTYVGVAIYDAETLMLMRTGSFIG